MKQTEMGSTDRMFERINGYGVLPAQLTPDKAVSAVMCTLFQRISRGEALDVLFSFPAKIGIPLATCALHKSEAGDENEFSETFGQEEFLRRVADHLAVSVEAAEQITIVVFREIQGFLAAKEISDVTSQLPLDLQLLWLQKTEARSKIAYGAA